MVIVDDIGMGVAHLAMAVRVAMGLGSFPTLVRAIVMKALSISSAEVLVQT